MAKYYSLKPDTLVQCSVLFTKITLQATAYQPISDVTNFSSSMKQEVSKQTIKVDFF